MTEKTLEFFDAEAQVNAMDTADHVEEFINAQMLGYPAKPRPFRDFLLIISAVSLFFTVVSAMSHSPDHPIDPPQAKPVSLSSLINKPIDALYRKYVPVPNP